MSQNVLTGTGDIMPIQTMRQLTPAERSSSVMLKRMKEFDDHNKKKYVDSCSAIFTLNTMMNHLTQIQGRWKIYMWRMKDKWYEDGDGLSAVPEVDDINNYDLYMEAEVMLPRDGDHGQDARVVGVRRNSES